MVDGQRLEQARFRQLSDWGVAAAVLIGLVPVLDALSVWTMWHAYGVVQDYLAGGGATDDDLAQADHTVSLATIARVIVLLVAGVVFLVWLWRARVNAEEQSASPHRRSRPWVVWGWIVPIVSLWFPYGTVDDIYRASRPAAPTEPDLDRGPGSPLLALWWALWLASLLLNRIADTLWTDATTLDALRTTAIVQIIETSATAAAATAIILIMRRITIWQSLRAVGRPGLEPGTY